MELIIFLIVAWVVGSLFGDKSGRAGVERPRHPPPSSAPPKTISPNSTERTLKTASEPREAKSPGLSGSSSLAELLRTLENASPPKRGLPTKLDSPKVPKRSWQEEEGGYVKKEAICPPGIGDDVLVYLRERGVKCLYHFTDRRNLDAIIQTGGLYSWYFLEQAGLVIPAAGGSDSSRRLDERKGLQNYVRLSFVPDHPMMYAAKAANRIGEVAVLEVDLDVVRFPDVLFSDRNAVANEARIGAGTGALANLKFDLLRKGRWSSDEEKGYIQAEVLVGELVPGYLVRHEGRLIRGLVKG